jgi:hypothetical protein
VTASVACAFAGVDAGWTGGLTRPVRATGGGSLSWRVRGFGVCAVFGAWTTGAGGGGSGAGGGAEAVAAGGDTEDAGGETR